MNAMDILEVRPIHERPEKPRHFYFHERFPGLFMAWQDWQLHGEGLSDQQDRGSSDSKQSTWRAHHRGADIREFEDSIHANKGYLIRSVSSVGIATQDVY